MTDMKPEHDRKGYDKMSGVCMERSGSMDEEVLEAVAVTVNNISGFVFDCYICIGLYGQYDVRG